VDSRPTYAILSHTWNVVEGDVMEVSYQDILSGRAKSNKGYGKIEGCCKQALADRIEYVWLDTCCIDKTSSSELSEAINSMFRWYAEARLCYAYLSDVGDSSVFSRAVGPKGELREDIKKSRWFTRGWTLQELLAPRRLYFFSANWNLLGTREEWRNSITAITRIHPDALVGEPERIASNFSVAQRMSWAANRVTTREEDMAYCLMGIFNVNMPLLYGEGGSKAFVRLQEEIIKDSDDQSIFSWSPEPLDNSLLVGLLAPWPSMFTGCGGIVAFRPWKTSTPFSMTNSGLRITGPLRRIPEDPQNESNLPQSSLRSDYELLLGCCRLRYSEKPIGIRVRELFPGGDQYARVHSPINEFTGTLPTEGYPPKRVYVRKRILQPPRHQFTEIGKFLVFNLSFTPPPWITINIKDVYPPGQLEKVNGDNGLVISPPAFGEVSSAFGNWTWHVAIMLERHSQQKSSCFILFLGYNAVNDRCWYGSLAFSENERKTLSDIWISGCKRHFVNPETPFSLEEISWLPETSESWDLSKEIIVTVGRKE
jgi:hypothetical protein